MARTPLAQATRDAIQRYALKPLVWNETRVRVEGLDVLEDLRPPVIFVSNHSSHLDAPLMLTDRSVVSFVRLLPLIGG